MDPLEEFQQDRQLVASHPQNLAAWQTLLAHILRRLGSVNAKEISPDFKQFITASYDEAVDKFPYLVDFWKQYSVHQYKIHGTTASIGVLERSVDACPYSIELWDDYLSALQLEKDPRYLPMVEFCLDLNGYHFMSHGVWDRLLAHKNDVDTYKKLVQIPLYEYARYYNEFVKISKQEPDKVLEFDDDVTEIDKNQRIDEYSYNVFVSTQKRVNEKWEFEADLESKWLEYLSYEVANGTEESVVNTFERCLVAHWADEKVWLKYLAYTNSYQPSKMDSLYQRAIKFIPIEDNYIRLHYARYLKNTNRLELMNVYLLDLLRFFLKPYRKKQYLDTVRAICADLSEPELVEILQDKSTLEVFALLNNQTFPVVLEVYLTKLMAANNVAKIRETFRYHSSPHLQNDDFFWTFYVEFEASRFNYANVNAIAEHVRTHTLLPPAARDRIARVHHELRTAR